MFFYLLYVRVCTYVCVSVPFQEVLQVDPDTEF